MTQSRLTRLKQLWAPSVFLFCHVFGSAALVGSAYAQATGEVDALRQEIKKLHERQDALERDLNAIKSRLTPRAATADAVDLLIDIERSPSKGDNNAQVTLIEFSDYQCPFCARHAQQTMSQIEKDYINTGKLRFVFRDFPIEAIHPKALKLHAAAHCAGEQGRYWEMHDQLFGRQKQLRPDDPSTYALQGGDGRRFEECVEQDRYTDQVRQSLADAQKIGLRATPTFFLGITSPQGSPLRATLMIHGALPYSVFREAIDRLLTKN